MWQKEMNSLLQREGISHLLVSNKRILVSITENLPLLSQTTTIQTREDKPGGCRYLQVLETLKLGFKFHIIGLQAAWSFPSTWWHYFTNPKTFSLWCDPATTTGEGHRKIGSGWHEINPLTFECRQEDPQIPPHLGDRSGLPGFLFPPPDVHGRQPSK